MTGRIRGYCALCRSRCGCISVVEHDRLVAVEPDPSHPTGAALCAKGRAAPELVHHPDRLLSPLRRTRPKGDPDPGWERITWNEALEQTAAALRRIADESGPEAVAFAVTSPSGTAISDAAPWIDRFMNAFGSPNNCYGTEVCNWHKDHATRYTFGAGIPAPDFARTGCVLYWGHNPSTSWLTHATLLDRLEVRHRKYADPVGGRPRGFTTPSRKVEIYSQRFLEHGQSPLPEYVEPLVSPTSRPELAARYPFVLTCAKVPQFCHSQHRGLPALRRLLRDPEVQIHPSAAAARGIAAGAWVVIETPDGRVRARARLDENLDPRVVSGQHGWWQACAAIGAPAYDAYAAEGANFNVLISSAAADPISGSVPHRAYVCEIRPVER